MYTASLFVGYAFWKDKRVKTVRVKLFESNVLNCCLWRTIFALPAMSGSLPAELKFRENIVYNPRAFEQKCV